MLHHWVSLLCVLIAIQRSWQRKVEPDKDGFCSNAAAIDVICKRRIDQCCYDSECPGIQKCCFTFCGYTCMDPIPHDNGNVDPLPPCQYSVRRK
uniref:U70-Liphistoxin-Lth1a_1 n=1 Tax=Liphistius thaleban TaxID=1905330 RepID=A0A4Q8K1Y1_9ARAC